MGGDRLPGIATVFHNNPMTSIGAFEMSGHKPSRPLISLLLGGVIAAFSTVTLLYSAQSAWHSYGQFEKANNTLTLTEISRSLLKTLYNIRLERGQLVLALNMDHAADQTVLSRIATYRDAAEHSYNEVIATIAESSNENLQPFLEKLKADHDNAQAARRMADGGIQVAKSARDATLAKSVGDSLNAHLDVLTSVTDGIDSKIFGLDDGVDRYLGIKQSAWNARVAAGKRASRIQTAVAAGKPWTLDDIVPAAEERGRESMAASMLKASMAANGLDPALTELYAKVDERNFAASTIAAQKKTVDELTSGTLVSIALKELQPQDTENQALIVELAYKALDEMVARADAVLDASKASLFYGASFLGLSLVLTVAGILIITSRVSTPLRRLKDSMTRLASGDTDSLIPYIDRSDEIGSMAGSVEVFRFAAMEKKRLEGEAEDNRRQAEANRIADQEKAERDAAERLRQATSGLALGLKRLASGDLAFQIDEAFAPDFEALRHDFNQSIRQLSTTLSEISGSIASMDSGTREIASGAQDLSKRTEQQAASLEETAAALEEITANVASSTKRTEEARTVASVVTLTPVAPERPFQECL